MIFIKYTAFYFSGIILNSTLNRTNLNDKLKNSQGAGFDMMIEMQIAKNVVDLLNQQRIDCDSNQLNDNLIQLICILNIVPNSVDENVLFFIIFYFLFFIFCFIYY